MKKEINWSKVSMILASLLSLIRIYQVIDEIIKKKKEEDRLIKIEADIDQINDSCDLMEGRITFIEKCMESSL